MRKSILISILLLTMFSLINGEDDFNSEIYLTEDILYKNKLEQAFTSELEERYDDALTIYMGILANLEKDVDESGEPIHVVYRSNLYKDIYDKNNIIGRYLPVKDFVLNQIAELPIEVRKRYERLISSKSDSLYAEAMQNYDKQAIYNLAENYFLAEKGYEYLFHAGKLAFESAEFALSVYYLEKMNNFWSKQFDENALCVFYLAASYAGAGNMFNYNKFLESALIKYKGLSITIGDKVYNDISQILTYDKLKEIILNDLKMKDVILKWGSDAAQDNMQFDFNKFSGNATIIGFPNVVVRERYNNYGYYGRYSNQQSSKQTIPAFSENRIVVSDHQTLQKIDISSREFKRAHTQISFPDSIYTPKNGSTNSGLNLNRVLVSGRYAYGLFNKVVQNTQEDDYGYYYRRRSQTTIKILACIDLEKDNEIVWWVPGRAEELDIEEFNKIPIEYLTNICIDSSFVYNDNKIYAAGIYPGDKEKRYFVMCFDATPDPKTGGKLLWKTKLATVQTDGWNSFDETRKMPTFVMKYHSGLLYVLSNKGIIVCLDGSNGNVKYVNRYMRPKTVSNPDEESRFFYREESEEVTHWSYNPIVIHKGFMYFTPMDSRKLYVVKAQTGEFVREFPFGSESVEDYLYILGVSNDTLHIQGKQHCYGLNLKLDFDPTSESAQNYELLTYKTVPFDVFGLQDKTLGRGVLGKDYLYIPTRKGIIRFNAKSGVRMNEILAWRTSSNEAMIGDLYLYKTTEFQYLVSVNAKQIVLMPVE